jgi:hypothetical protein
LSPTEQQHHNNTNMTMSAPASVVQKDTVGLML